MSMLLRVIVFCALLLGVLLAGRGQPVAAPTSLAGSANGQSISTVLFK